MSSAAIQANKIDEASGYKTEVVDDKKEVPRAASKEDNVFQALVTKVGIGGGLLVASICTSIYATAAASTGWALVSIGLFLGFCAYLIWQFRKLFSSFSDDSK